MFGSPLNIRSESVGIVKCSTILIAVACHCNSQWSADLFRVIRLFIGSICNWIFRKTNPSRHLVFPYRSLEQAYETVRVC